MRIFDIAEAVLLFAIPLVSSISLNRIPTTSGLILGHVSSNRSEVIEYLGIPYAGPTSGSQRFLPPTRFNSIANFDASSWGPSCPAVLGGTIAFPNKTAQFDRIVGAFLGQGGNVQSEDCLSANIWVKSTNSTSPKAVLVFFPGGRWNAGGSKSLFYNGQYLADAEDIIVVTINYRLNIFGFSGAPGIQQNAGLNDQRMALEWLRDNIAAFGGDSKRITIFGQSAGSVSVGYHAYAYQHDPIVAGYIMESGTPHSWEPLSPELASQHWSDAASTLGCNNSSNVLRCMQSHNTSSVLAAFASVPYDATNALFQPQFQPVVDNIIVFQNYSALVAAGEFAKLPSLIGNTNHESGFYQIAAFSTGKFTYFNSTLQTLFNLEAFTCASAQEAENRVSQGAPVWRYRYFGDYSNLRLFPDSGAYHGSELNMVFGTAQDVSGLPSDAAELAMVAYMQKAWAAFARDPKQGLLKTMDWPMYDPKDATLIQLGLSNGTLARFANASSSDAQCTGLKRGVNLGKGAM